MRAAKHLPDLIVLDLMMPIMDGYGFRENQELDSRIAHIPVVVMTADGHIEAKKAKIGAVAFIRKPPELETVLQLVHKHIL